MPHIIPSVLAAFFLFSALLRPLLPSVESVLGTIARDFLACLALPGIAYLTIAHPHSELVGAFAVAGGVLLLHAITSTLQEYRHRGAQTIALSQRRRFRTPGPK